jgi:hypothetical protein
VSSDHLSPASTPSERPTPRLNFEVCQEVGVLLGAARTERRLSVAGVASQLLLSTAQVRGLERGDSVAFYGPVFFANAARRYAALVDAPLPQQGLLVTPESLRTQEAQPSTSAQHTNRSPAIHLSPTRLFNRAAWTPREAEKNPLAVAHRQSRVADAADQYKQDPFPDSADDLGRRQTPLLTIFWWSAGITGVLSVLGIDNPILLDVVTGIPMNGAVWGGLIVGLVALVRAIRK